MMVDKGGQLYIVKFIKQFEPKWSINIHEHAAKIAHDAIILESKKLHRMTSNIAPLIVKLHKNS